MALPDSQKHVLVSGAGIAGLVAAFWLLRAGWRVTVVERATDLRLNGQSVDIKDSAADVIRYMGLEEEIKAKITHEKGVSFVNEFGKSFAILEASPHPNPQGPIAEFEIVRGDLVNILIDAIKHNPNANFIFGDYVKATDRHQDGSIQATFNNRSPQSYHLIIAADGLGSKFRSKITDGVSEKPVVQSLYRFSTYFTIDQDLFDERKDLSIWLSLEGGRSVMLRADPSNRTWAALGLTVDPADQQRLEQYRTAVKADPTAMKDILVQNFPEDSWVLPQIRKGVENATDLYSTEVALVRAPRLYRDGVVLVGDAGYCPTPYSGVGCTLAIIGAYVLAGQIMRHPGDVEAALAEYEKLILPVARNIQSQAESMAMILSPSTRWALFIRKHGMRAFAAVSKSWVGKLMERLANVNVPGLYTPPFKPPAYEWEVIRPR